MADDSKVLIELDLQSEEFKKKLSDAETSLKRTGEGAEKSFSGLGASIIAINQGLELLHKGMEIVKDLFVETIGESIKASMDQERSLTQLNLALANAGYSTKQSKDAWHSLTEEIEKNTTLTGDQAMALQTQAINMTQSEETAKKMTKAAIELSAATGMDAGSAMQRLAMSMNGVSRGLDKLVPGMKNLSEAELQAGAAADLILQRFGGSSEFQLQTFNGRVQMLTKSWEKFHETVGDVITQSPIVNRALEGIRLLVEKLTEMFTEWAEGGGFEKLLKTLVSISDTVITYVVRPLELFYNFGKFVVLGTISLFQSLAATIIDVGATIGLALINPVMDALQVMGKAVGVFSEEFGKKITGAVKEAQDTINANTKEFATAMNVTAMESAEKMDDSIMKLYDFPIADKMGKMVQDVQKYFEGAKAPMKEMSKDMGGLKDQFLSVGGAFGKMAEGFKAQVVDLNKNINKNFSDMGKTMFNTLAKGGAQAFAAFGKAAAEGKDGLKAFTDSLIQTLGNMAVQTGEMFFAQGAAATWAGMPNGPSLMSAGAALAAIGGAMSAAGGGGGSAPSGGSSSSPSIGGGSTNEVVSPVPEQTKETPRSKAQIIINGDFLNSRETANHLAEVLRQNSDITDYAIVAQGKQYA